MLVDGRADHIEPKRFSNRIFLPIVLSLSAGVATIACTGGPRPETTPGPIPVDATPTVLPIATATQVPIVESQEPIRGATQVVKADFPSYNKDSVEELQQVASTLNSKYALLRRDYSRYDIYGYAREIVRDSAAFLAQHDQAAQFQLDGDRVIINGRRYDLSKDHDLVFAQALTHNGLRLIDETQRPFPDDYSKRVEGLYTKIEILPSDARPFILPDDQNGLGTISEAFELLDNKGKKYPHKWQRSESYEPEYLRGRETVVFHPAFVLNGLPEFIRVTNPALFREFTLASIPPEGVVLKRPDDLYRSNYYQAENSVKNNFNNRFIQSIFLSQSVGARINELKRSGLQAEANILQAQQRVFIKWLG